MAGSVLALIPAAEGAGPEAETAAAGAVTGAAAVTGPEGTHPSHVAAVAGHVWKPAAGGAAVR